MVAYRHAIMVAASLLSALSPWECGPAIEGEGSHGELKVKVVLVLL